MPRLTILIACPGDDDRAFEDTLASVLQHRPDDVEVMVVLSQPYDDPYGLGDEVRFVHVANGASRIRLVLEGVQAAASEWVHLLDCGCEVREGWCDAALVCSARPRVAAIGTRLQRGGVPAGTPCSTGLGATWDGRLFSADWDTHPSRWLGPSISAAFYRRGPLLALLEEFADVELEETTPLALGMMVAAVLRTDHWQCRLVDGPGISVPADSPGSQERGTAFRHGWLESAVLLPFCLERAVSTPGTGAEPYSLRRRRRAVWRPSTWKYLAGRLAGRGTGARAFRNRMLRAVERSREQPDHPREPRRAA